MEDIKVPILKFHLSAKPCKANGQDESSHLANKDISHKAVQVSSPKRVNTSVQELRDKGHGSPRDRKLSSSYETGATD